MNQHVLNSLSALALACLLFGCDEKKKDTSEQKLLETVELHGTCKEDHASVGGYYTATVRRYEYRKDPQSPTETVAYGYAMSTADPMKDLEEDMKDPMKTMGKYRPPFTIDLLWIDIDTSQDHWILHGMSSDEGKQGYATTCDLKVMNRTAGEPTADAQAPTNP